MFNIAQFTKFDLLHADRGDASAVWGTCRLPDGRQINFEDAVGVARAAADAGWNQSRSPFIDLRSI
jgi:hypothetical protein